MVYLSGVKSYAFQYILTNVSDVADFLGCVQDTYIVMVWGCSHIIERIIPWCIIGIVPETRNIVNNFCWFINIMRLSSSHHYIHMFVELDTVGSFTKAVTGLVFSGGLNKVNKFIINIL